MSPDNSRGGGATGYCLVTADAKHFIFFFEDVDAATIDLNGMRGSQPVVLVDAKADYDEIDMGRLTAGIHMVNPSSTSGWALAVGEFGVGRSERCAQ